MEAQTSTLKGAMPVKADFANGISLAQELEQLDTNGLIAYADEKFSLTVDPGLDPQTIKENLLRIHASMRNSARETNRTSLQKTIALDQKRKKAWDAWQNDKRVKKPPFVYEPNPPIEVHFYFMQHVGANCEFANTHPYGFTAKGGTNEFGFKKAPKYNLFHGEMYVLPLLLVKELERLIYTSHKPVIDRDTGLQNGTIPIIKPRFVFKPNFTTDELVALSEMRKEKQNGKQDIS